MKKLLSTLFIATIAVSGFAQSAKYADAMTKALAEFDTISTGDQFMAVANKFERIAMAEKNQWQPYYYSGLARATAVFVYNDNAKTDAILDVAEAHAAKADSLSPSNSEIYVLKSMILGGRIMVDPMTRGQSYGMQSMMLINKAMSLDPNNPRAYFIMGQSLFYTPEQFGGGKTPGCSMMKTAKEKYATFKPAHQFDPNWGEEQVDEMLKQCNQ